MGLWSGYLNSGRDAQIAIEIDDDVSVIEGDSLKLESDKHSINVTSPFSDRSRDFWKTIYIWIDLIEKDYLLLENTKFYMATNKIVNSELIKKLGSQNKSEEELEELIIKLEEIAKTPSDTIKEYTKKFLDFDKGKVKEFISRVELIDGSKKSGGESFNEDVCNLLHIPKSYDEDDIVNQLKGWIFSVCLFCWRNHDPAVISRDSFDKYYYRIISNIRTRKFRERTKDMIPRPDDSDEENRDRVFIKQLLLISDEDEQEEYILDAIDDYICSKIEWVRLAKDGDVSVEEFKHFEKRLVERWKILRKKIIKKNRPDNKVLPKNTGEEIYLEILDHRENLAGQITDEYYLTRGSYHNLADRTEVGWHPEYVKLLEENENE